MQKAVILGLTMSIILIISFVVVVKLQEKEDVVVTPPAPTSVTTSPEIKSRNKQYDGDNFSFNYRPTWYIEEWAGMVALSPQSVIDAYGKDVGFPLLVIRQFNTDMVLSDFVRDREGLEYTFGENISLSGYEGFHVRQERGSYTDETYYLKEGTVIIFTRMRLVQTTPGASYDAQEYLEDFVEIVESIRFDN